eukprot:GDKJ01027852.1.p1 GENE.GDKJ01027852.1~~GDKJ01027852.1.p1  ORF type:complete len:237 (-),score=30.31 GDKJ01027852.1:350-1060(-)
MFRSFMFLQRRMFSTTLKPFLSIKGIDLPPIIASKNMLLFEAKELILSAHQRSEFGNLYKFSEISIDGTYLFCLSDELKISPILEKSKLSFDHPEIKLVFDINNVPLDASFDSDAVGIICPPPHIPPHTFPDSVSLLSALDPLWPEMQSLEGTALGELLRLSGAFSRRESLDAITSDANAIFHEVNKWLVLVASCCRSPENRGKRMKFFSNDTTLEERVFLVNRMITTECFIQELS